MKPFSSSVLITHPTPSLRPEHAVIPHCAVALPTREWGLASLENAVDGKANPPAACWFELEDEPLAMDVRV